MNKNREYRTLANILNPNQGSKRIDSDFYIEGYATTFDKPYLLAEYSGEKYFEVISSSAFRSADMTDVIMQYDHTGKVLARISNKTLIIEPDSTGLFIAADLSKSTAAKELYEEISAELITKMSWAFTVSKQEWVRDENARTVTRKILEIKKVYDVSAVSIPANDMTEIGARSGEKGSTIAALEEFRGREKETRRLLLLAQTMEVLK